MYVREETRFEKEPRRMQNKKAGIASRREVLPASHNILIQCKGNKGGKKSGHQKMMEDRQEYKEQMEARERGAQRAENYRENWERLDWRTYIHQFGLKVSRMDNSPGKIIFILDDGSQIVIDRGGGYWRHFDGYRQYYDGNHELHPNTAEFHAVTHFLN